MIGLVGHSGSRQEYLINLLMRFYDVDEGRNSGGWRRPADIDRNDLRSQIGVVLQEPYLFHGTVSTTSPTASRKQLPVKLWQQLKRLTRTTSSWLPGWLRHGCRRRGTRLSGGERQRISIARAILHDPRILILDEATASVDTQTEQQIQQALQNLIKGRTTFAIAHRLSTLRNASRLIVLDNGRIAEQGTHDELINRRGVFYKLVNAQKALNEITAIGG
jgi:ATP-binding cassette subfamily B protein